jgi:hypothetical protein
VSVLWLDPSQYLRRGGRRLIFQDPGHADRLIKVLRPDKIPSKRSWLYRPRSLYRIYQQELCEYLRLRSLCMNDGPVVAPFYGLLETSIGLGLQVARIEGRDGRLAPTLDDLIGSGSVTSDMRLGVDRLAQKLGNLGIVVSDFKSHNLALLPDGVNFCVVDGLGEKLTFSLRPHSTIIARSSIELARRKIQWRIDHRLCRANRNRAVVSGSAAGLP